MDIARFSIPKKFSVIMKKITRKLYQDSLEIHKNLITLEATLDDNVLAFRRKE